MGTQLNLLYSFPVFFDIKLSIFQVCVHNLSTFIVHNSMKIMLLRYQTGKQSHIIQNSSIDLQEKL